MLGAVQFASPVWAQDAEATQSAASADAQSPVFLWEDAGAANEIVNDAGDIVGICRVEPHERAKFGRYLVMDVAGGGFEATVGDEIAAACRASGQLTMEATITAALIHDNQGQIVALTPAEGEPLLSLLQRGDEVVVQVAASTGQCSCSFPAPKVGAPTPVAVTYSASGLRVYTGGKLSASADAAGDLSHWTQTRLTFGGGDASHPGWRGTIEAVAVFDRALADSEISERFNAHAERVKDREAAPRAVVEAKLVELSETPTVAEISPYRRALAAYTYEVERVVEGACDAKRVQVAHWVIMDRRTLPNVRQLGQSYRITFEPFDEHDELEAERLVSDSEEFDLPLFYDVGE